MVRLNNSPDMTLDVYRGRKTTIQQQSYMNVKLSEFLQKGLQMINSKTGAMTYVVTTKIYNSGKCMQVNYWTKLQIP